jgi:hypothetical protein
MGLEAQPVGDFSLRNLCLLLPSLPQVVARRSGAAG